MSFFQSGDFYTRHFQPTDNEETLVVNMGPQHPSTHGVLRIIVELDGEYVKRCEPVLGYVHRMHEFMGQTKSWVQFWPNMGRVDYLHALAWNWAWAGAVERLGEIEVPERAEYIRVITCELNRISSHLLWWGAYLLDLGAFTPIMYAFDDREKIMDMLQEPTGSRLTYSYYRFGGVSADLSDKFLKNLAAFVPYLRSRLPMYRDLVTENVILRKRVEDIGHIDADMCRRYGCTGPVSRGAGLGHDTRRVEPYSVYDRFDWEVPVYTQSDAWARYMVRMDEIEQSLRIIEQAVATIPAGPFLAKTAPKPKWSAPKGETCFAVEGARGKIVIYVASDGGRTPYRVKLRSPSYSNLSCFAEAGRGVLLADAVSILGSLDLVIPEIDR